MKRRLPFALTAVILLALAGLQWLGERRGPSPVPVDNRIPAAAEGGATRDGTAGNAAADGAARNPAEEAAARGAAIGDLVVHGVVVRDVDGRVAWRGDVDLAPTLRRIETGVRDSHRNDGEVFGNRERLLPVRPAGYYREYVVRTPGLSHAGPQRLIVGRDGDAYYTSDHYASFQRVR